jgi:hypothetical protein
MNKIDDLISRHWKWAKNKIGKDGIKYSKKYSENEHEKFIRKWIDNMGFDDIEMRLIYVMKYNKLLHVV